MSSKDEFLSIITRHGFSGDVANLLADLFAFYSDKYLTDIASQYYNSSVAKAANIDALLQLSLDHAYPVWRGTNTTLEFGIIEAKAPITLQPLQEIFSYGSHFFYYGGREPIYLGSENERDRVVPIIYANKAKRVLEFGLNRNEIYVIDDEDIISEHVVFYILYEYNNLIQQDHIKHTRYPSKFWGYISDANPDNPNAYDILVLTTPGFGLYAKFSERITRFEKTRKIRLEYLNWTSAMPNREILARFYAHLSDKLKLVLYRVNNIGDERSYFRISSHTPQDSDLSIRNKIMEGARFNGIIRSITDIKTWMEEEIVDMIYDMRSFHFINSGVSATSRLPNIYYVFVVILRPGYTLNDVDSIVSARLPSVWYTNFPMLNIQSLSDSTGSIYNAINSITGSAPAVNISPSDIIVIEAIPCTLTIHYSVVSSNKNLVYGDLLEYTSQFVDRLIEVIEPTDIFTRLSKNANVERVDYFAVSMSYDYNGNTFSKVFFRYFTSEFTVHAIDIYGEGSANSITNSNTNTVYLFPYSERIVLIGYEAFYRRLSANQFTYQSLTDALDLRSHFLYVSEVVIKEIDGSL